MTYLADVAAASEDVARVSGRRMKTARLAELLARLEDGEVEIAIAFLSGSPRQGRIGVGGAAIASSTDVGPAEAPRLTLGEVDDAFEALGRVAGKGAARARAQALGSLFSRATAGEQDFLRRLLFGELRQGALEGVLVDAVALAASVPAAHVRRAAMMAGDLGPVAAAALRAGAPALDAFTIQIMRPVQPMLAESADDVEAALAEIGDASFELKLDGARIQAHKLDDDVRLYSRSLRDMTAEAPEVVSIVRALPAQSLILDGEMIALQPDRRPYPFQMTMRRRHEGGKGPRHGEGREGTEEPRHGEGEGTRRRHGAVPLTPFFFDCLYLDGAPLIDEPQERRFGALLGVATGTAVPRIARPTLEQALAFTRDAIAQGHEGVMAKSLGAPYAAGRRGASWLKIKQPRTLDLVVLAAEWGHGRRQGWLSNLHLGARDPERNAFVMLGKTFKGLTDEMLAWQTERLLALEIGRDGITVFVRPELVAEIAFNEIQQSPVYPGGLALRFARVRRYRSDKTAAGADTIATVRALAGTGPGRDGTGASDV